MPEAKTKTPTKTKNLTRIALTCLVGGALFLAACDDDGGNGDDNGDGTTVPTTTATETATTTATETASPTATETETATPTETADGTGDGVALNVEDEGDLAPYLVDGDGMTLYTFANDEAGVSNCDADCEANWPPLTVESGEEPTAGDGVDGDLGTIERDDGTLHVTYNDQPLYYYAADQAPGDTTGHEVGDLWFVAEPEGDSAASGS